jgi:hypothetical protein
MLLFSSELQVKYGKVCEFVFKAAFLFQEEDGSEEDGGLMRPLILSCSK